MQLGFRVSRLLIERVGGYEGGEEESAKEKRGGYEEHGDNQYKGGNDGLKAEMLILMLRKENTVRMMGDGF